MPGEVLNVLRHSLVHFWFATVWSISGAPAGLQCNSLWVMGCGTSGRLDPFCDVLPLERAGKNMSKSETLGRGYWLIAKRDNGRMEVLAVDLGGEGEALAVFGFEEAAMYLNSRLGSSALEWRVRQTSVGELISVLYGPRSDVKRVTLDPVPEEGGEALTDVLSMERKDFLRVLLGAGPSDLGPEPPESLFRTRV